MIQIPETGGIEPESSMSDEIVTNHGKNHVLDGRWSIYDHLLSQKWYMSRPQNIDFVGICMNVAINTVPCFVTGFVIRDETQNRVCA